MSTSLTELAVDGGAAASDPLLQAQSNSTGLIVRRPASLESTAKGVALLAGVEAGAIASLEDLIPQRKKNEKLFSPEMSSNSRQHWKHKWHDAVKRSLNWHEH